MLKQQPSAPDILRSVARLRRILEASKLLNSTLDLNELTRIILRIVRDETSIDRSTVFVVDKERQQIRSIVAEGVETEIVLPVGTGIAGTVAATGEVIDIPDAYADPRFDSRFDLTLGYRTTDIYCMPIINRTGGVVGVLELMNRSRPLTEEDAEFLSGVSVHVGLALENAWLHREMVEKRKIEQELDLARDIQHKFYPKLPASYGGVQIAASSVMCAAVGGDYLGYFPMEEGRFIIMLGDVSGKGIGAALVMTSLNATCRTLARHIHSLEKISIILNETLVETTGPATFVTLAMVLVDPVKNRLHYICCGHNPMLQVNGAGQSFLIDGEGGLPLGLFSGLTYRRQIIEVAAGSLIVLYTDGVSDAENAETAQFGLDRLSKVVQEHAQEPANGVHQAIRDALAEYVGAVAPNDDSTMIVLKF